MSTWLVDRVGGLLERRTSRRGFLVRAAVVGSAMAVDPLEYVLHPRPAYAVVCQCGDTGCGCDSACCDGYTEFCCTLNGSNTCPPGTVAGGWWRADGSTFCGGGPRYYIDCHGECSSSDGSGPFCPDTDGLECGCAQGDCGNRQVGCVEFRYGQCHQEIAQVGRIACRVVTCTPAYLLDNSCTNTALYDDATAEHNRPCLQGPALVARAYSAAAPQAGDGLWLVGPNGGVYTFGSAAFHGSMVGVKLNAPTVAIAATPSGNGYWLAANDGGVFCFGDASFHGSLGSLRLVAPIVGMAVGASGAGYWLVAADGGVFTFGSLAFLGSAAGQPLNAPIVGMAATGDGAGYWLVAADGSVFAFGSAVHHGSTAARPLRNLIVGIVPTATSGGYWLWGEDGSVFAFGDAVDLGDYPRMPAAQRDLPSDGIDAFHALVVRPGTGYTLWAVSPLQPPPATRRYEFTPPPTTAPTSPPGLFPLLPPPP
ncbi:MAG: twin-arginine translocation signal domain-containing protein [Acidimicrobiales bacterium]